MSCGEVKSSCGAAGGWDRSGCTQGAPKSANGQGKEQHSHTERRCHTKKDEGECSKQGGGGHRTVSGPAGPLRSYMKW